MRQLAILALLLSSLGCSAGSETEEKPEVAGRSGKKHTSDEKINEKIDRYLDLLQIKKKAIEKFLKDNYSDFNHSDYTPEVGGKSWGLGDGCDVLSLQEYVSHPINAYMLMKRTSVIWNHVKPSILDPAADRLWDEIQEDMKSLPREELWINHSLWYYLSRFFRAHKYQ